MCDKEIYITTLPLAQWAFLYIFILFLSDIMHPEDR
jgi:hypothetical protein